METRRNPSSGVPSGFDGVRPERHLEQVGHRIGAQLFHDVGAMGFHRLDADIQIIGDLLVSAFPATML